VIGHPQLAVDDKYIDSPSGTVKISNVGSGILAWRTKAAPAWVRVNRQAGVALGPNMICVNPCDRTPRITITIAQNAPPGALGLVYVTNLITGNSQAILVRAPTGPTPTP
jgi:hypothetical protein